jgi:hypothetical protein
MGGSCHSYQRALVWHLNQVAVSYVNAENEEFTMNIEEELNQFCQACKPSTAIKLFVQVLVLRSEAPAAGEWESISADERCFGGLGYHANGASVTLAAILPTKDGSLQVVDLITADLSWRRERIKNASRMIKMCGILRWLQQLIGEGKDIDMFLQGQWAPFFYCHLVH